MFDLPALNNVSEVVVNLEAAKKEVGPLMIYSEVKDVSEISVG
jgi:ATP-dependent protease Clp ATPase subunit